MQLNNLIDLITKDYPKCFNKFNIILTSEDLNNTKRNNTRSTNNIIYLLSIKLSVILLIDLVSF